MERVAAMKRRLAGAVVVVVVALLIGCCGCGGGSARKPSEVERVAAKIHCRLYERDNPTMDGTEESGSCNTSKGDPVWLYLAPSPSVARWLEVGGRWKWYGKVLVVR